VNKVLPTKAWHRIESASFSAGLLAVPILHPVPELLAVAVLHPVPF